MDLQLQNIQYTLDAVRLAKRLGCKVFVGAGSQAEYGRYEGKLDAKVPVFPEKGFFVLPFYEYLILPDIFQTEYVHGLFSGR